MKTVIGTIILLIAVFASLVLYIVVAGQDFSHWSYLWLVIGFITFFMASGIVIGAMLIEKGINEK